MSEVSDAFRRIERPNVRTNTSVQPFHCALRSFAQPCFQWMEQQLYRVKVRRKHGCAKLRSAQWKGCTEVLVRTFGRSILRNASLTSDIRGTNHYDRDALIVGQAKPKDALTAAQKQIDQATRS